MTTQYRKIMERQAGKGLQGMKIARGSISGLRYICKNKARRVGSTRLKTLKFV